MIQEKKKKKNIFHVRPQWLLHSGSVNTPEGNNFKTSVFCFWEKSQPSNNKLIDEGNFILLKVIPSIKRRVSKITQLLANRTENWGGIIVGDNFRETNTNETRENYQLDCTWIEAS